MNGLTQGKIALILSSIILVFGYGFMLVVYYQMSSFPKILFLLPLVLVALIYFATMLLIEFFILRKVRILYRTINTIDKKVKRDSLQDPELFEKLRLKVARYKDEKAEEIEKLKENEKFRKEFVGNVSHELKTPLFSIQGFIELLSNPNLADEKRLNYIDKLSKNTDRLITIVDDLMTINKLENQRESLEMQSFNIYDLCLDVTTTLEEMAKKKKISIEFPDNQFISFTVKADKFRISQVLHNLIENGIHYNPEKTKIEIRFFDQERKVLVEIKDNGVGIEDVHLDRIFERFYRVNDDRNRKMGGSGLGLSIVKHIIEAHQQKITISSKVQVGTTFQFTLDKN